MKRVRVTIHTQDLELPLTYERATSERDTIDRVQVINWNIVAPTASFLLRVRGDVHRFEELLREDSAIDEYELLPVTERESYCFVTGAGTPDARALWENFKRGSLMTIPPAEWNIGESYTFTAVGRRSDIQAAIDGMPDNVRVDIESIGGKTVADDGVVDRLSDRQREAVRTAIDLGYYDTPRGATSDEIARELNCATSTAAEHLRKAESKVIPGVFEV